MKRHLFIALFLLAGTAWQQLAAKITAEERYQYVIKKAAISKAKAAQLHSVFLAYLKELEAAKNIYEKPKAQHKAALKSRSISEEQAAKLLALHWEADAKELAVKRKYAEAFCRFLTAGETLAVFTYANDSKEKMLVKE